MRTVLRVTWQGLEDLRAHSGFKHPFMPPQTYCSRQLHQHAFARTCQQQQRAGTWPQMRQQVQAAATQRDPARQSKRSHSGATKVPDQPAQLAQAAEPASPGLSTSATDTAGGGDSASEQQKEQHAAALAQAGAAMAGTDAGELSEKRGSASGKQRRARRYYYTGTIGETHLKCVAGVGPKNEQLLRGKGLDSVQALKELLREKHKLNTSLMMHFLKAEVGIRKQHTATIADDIRRRVEADLKDSSSQGGPAQRKVTLCVEGNISAGKSTFLSLMKEHADLSGMIDVVPEPVDKWQSVGQSQHNVLNEFYKHPERFAYTFQNYVFVTRMLQERSTQQGPAPLRVLERSVFSDRMVFVRAVHEKNKWLTDMELELYDSWFQPIVEASPSLVPDGFIYLQAEPDVCMTRLQHRQRAEESGVSLNYLADLHQMHEEWITQGQKPGSFSSDMMQWPSKNQLWLGTGPQELHGSPVTAPSEIAGKVLYLDAQRNQSMPHQIDGVPALVLSYDKHLDLKHDVDAKQEYATQVKAFFHYVQELQQQREKLKMAHSICTAATAPSVDERAMLELFYKMLGPSGSHMHQTDITDTLVKQLRHFAATTVQTDRQHAAFAARGL